MGSVNAYCGISIGGRQETASRETRVNKVPHPAAGLETTAQARWCTARTLAHASIIHAVENVPLMPQEVRSLAYSG